MDQTILALTGEIISSHVENNSVRADDLPTLIKSVYASLASLGTAVAPVEVQAPAVSIKASIKPDTITCLECGLKMKMLRRHLASHDLDEAGYRAKWSLPREYPMIAPNYAAKRRELAMTSGLGRKSKANEPALKVRKRLGVKV